MLATVPDSNHALLAWLNQLQSLKCESIDLPYPFDHHENSQDAMDKQSNQFLKWRLSGARDIHLDAAARYLSYMHFDVAWSDWDILIKILDPLII